MHLNLQTINKLPDAVRIPEYDRDNLSAGIIHIGLGNFHRAHMAWYSHRLMDQGIAHNWAILGAGVRSLDDVNRTKILEQDCFTTLIKLDPSGKSAEVIGSMIDYIPVEKNNASLIQHLIKPNIRIVSLTVTEGGYYQTPQGTLDIQHKDIQHDINHPQTPITVFGAILEAIKLRQDAGIEPFTCLSCDNLQANGDILRNTILGLAAVSKPSLVRWISENVTFPNSMVDCIVPATGPNELALVRDFGIVDNVPVTHESFRQWVIEDKFCSGRPEWDKVGVTFTDDVKAFELQKLRILNAGHQIIATVGELLSIVTISDTMKHPLIMGLFSKIQTEEIVPHVLAVPGMTPLEYVKLIKRRFSNTEIIDTTRRVAFDGSSRHPGFLHPIIRDAIATEKPIEGLALIEALWARMCFGVREDGSLIEANDPFWSELRMAANSAIEFPEVWLSQVQFYGDLGQDTRFAKCFTKWLNLVWEQGTEIAVQIYLES